MLTILIPLLMVVAGVLIYALASNPKVAEIGRLMAAAGFFALAFYFSGRAVSFG